MLGKRTGKYRRRSFAKFIHKYQRFFSSTVHSSRNLYEEHAETNSISHVHENSESKKVHRIRRLEGARRNARLSNLGRRTTSPSQQKFSDTKLLKKHEDVPHLEDWPNRWDPISV